MSINVTWERTEGILIAMLDGRVDGSNADEFLSALESGIGAADHPLILDLEKLSFISSAGLRVGLVMAKRFNEAGKKFGICALSGPVREVIAVSGFDRIITVYDSRAEAVKALEDK